MINFHIVLFKNTSLSKNEHNIVLQVKVAKKDGSQVFHAFCAGYGGAIAKCDPHIGSEHGIDSADAAQI